MIRSIGFSDIALSASGRLLAARRGRRYSHALTVVVHHAATVAFGNRHRGARGAAGHHRSRAGCQEHQDHRELTQQPHRLSSITESLDRASDALLKEIRIELATSAETWVE